MEVEGVIIHEWYDRYDFDPGKMAHIPGFGDIPDSAMKKLVPSSDDKGKKKGTNSLGKAAEFDMKCSWKQRVGVGFKRGDKLINWNWRIVI